MGVLSNNNSEVVDAIFSFLSIAISAGGTWLFGKADIVCPNLMRWPAIGIGMLLMVLSIAGFVGRRFRVSWLLWLLWVYLFFIYILTILLLCFMVFALVLINKGAGEVVSNRGFKEYRLGYYSNWMQKCVDNSDKWKKMNANICKSLADHSINEEAQEFYSRNLSPIESGCCKPPTSCGFTFVNATVWAVNTSSGVINTNPDCLLWSNDRDQLCYGCSACKASVLATMKQGWREGAILKVIAPVALVVVFCSVSFRAWIKTRRDLGYRGEIWEDL